MTISLTPREVRPWTHVMLLSMLCLLAPVSERASGEDGPWDLTPLEPAPDWRALDPFQRTVTQQEFQDELSRVFLSSAADAKGLIDAHPSHALIVRQSRRPDHTYRLEFGDGSSPSPSHVYWRPVASLPRLPVDSPPLQGLRIVVDPGHIGGEWARMERRWFLIPGPLAGKVAQANRPVKEGDMVLRVAELLEEKLTTLGARVALVRRRLEPVTDLRPADLLDSARRSLGLAPETSPETSRSLRDESERLFYLSAEIRARGERVNREFRPDLALCLHMNAEPWGDAARPSFVERNHFHILINGCFGRSELLKDDHRFFLVHRLLQRTHTEELALAETIAETMGPRLGLPAYEYRGQQAKRPGTNPFVWSRNLLATRIYHCPVIYFEPYVMNHELTHARVQAGEYQGTRPILGATYPNLFEEYASAVADGLAAYYSKHRHSLPATP